MYPKKNIYVKNASQFAGTEEELKCEHLRLWVGQGKIDVSWLGNFDVCCARADYRVTLKLESQPYRYQLRVNLQP